MSRQYLLDRGYLYALVLIDLFSRFGFALPLRTKTAGEVARNMRRVFDQKWLGAPTILLSDNGKEFTARACKRLCLCFGVTHKTITAYNPKGNGTVERFNQTLIRSLQAACADGSEWTEKLENVLEEYNTSPHSSTGVSPRELITARPMTLARLLPDAPQEWTQDNFAGMANAGKEEEWRQEVAKERKASVEHMTKMRTRTHRYANEKRVACELKVGDKVFWKDPRKGRNAASKLKTLYQGPNKILKLLPGGKAVIEIGSKKQKQVPLDHLKV